MKNKTIPVGSFNMTHVTQDQINGMTEYPSIFEPFERIKETRSKQFRNMTLGPLIDPDFPNRTFQITEKIDGTNAREIEIPQAEKVFLGGRTKLIYCNSDFLINDENSIIEMLSENGKILLAQLDNGQPHLPEGIPPQFYGAIDYGFIVFYYEVFGRNIQQRGKQYFPPMDEDDKKFQGKVRAFDIRYFTPEFIKEFLALPREQYHILRASNRGWLNPKMTLAVCNALGIPHVPVLGEVCGNDIDTPEKALAFLKQFPKSEFGVAQTEGVVLKDLLSSEYKHPDCAGLSRTVFKVKFSDFPKELPENWKENI